MAETKNTFIKSKMNQDLDQRLVPNGEYREAFNVSVSQAEGADVGTLETVLGNIKVTDLGLSSTCNAEIIGYYVDDQNKSIYLFVTNFVDTSSDKVSSYPPDTVLCQIWRRNVETNINTKLVEGKFLNFSLTHPITGVNLIEDLLFWTDNRNQPRKINVKAANPGSLTTPTYYTNDDQINVAKYYPYQPINLVKDYVVDFTIFSRGTGSPAYQDYIGEVVPTQPSSLPAVGTGLTVEIVAADAGTGELEQIRIVDPGEGYYNGQYVTIAPKIGNARIQLVVEEASTMKDKCTEKLPVNTTLGAPTAPVAGTVTAGTVFTINIPAGTPDYTGALAKITGSITSPYLARVISQTGTGAGATMEIQWANKYTTGPVYFPAAISGVTAIELGINPDYDANWPGDCEFLKDKFVRFAYRFKFDDNEYSLISPFTQPCFIPKQNGYFLQEERTVTSSSGSTSETVLDTEEAYKNTDNDVMENIVNSVDLQIPCPEFLDDSADTKFKNLTEQLHITEIDIIYKDDAENVLKVLDTITEESFADLNTGTLIYNYQSRKPKKTLPSSEITRVSDKVPIKALAQEVSGNRVIYGNYVDGYTASKTLDYEVSAAPKEETSSLKKEYPNHTLKQNRSYQVGVVLTDRYGRSSDVILSALDPETTAVTSVTYTGSTLFHPFYSVQPEGGLITSTSTWNGDALRVKFNSKVPLEIPQAGYPGLFLGYASSDISNLYGGGGYTSFTGLTTSGGTGTGLTVNITVDPAPLGGGSSLGIVQTVTINNPGEGYKQGDLITITGGTPTTQATFVYSPNTQPNLTGWYSYKIVVKQTEQDYYNVYLPGIVNGTLNTDTTNSATEAVMSLYGDNINKVPKSLLEVGPTQTTYNSDEILSLRVNNTNSFSSIQNYPGTETEKVTQIAELSDLGIPITRISKEIVAYAAGPPVTITYVGELDDKIQPGMAVTIANASGTITTPLSEGIYVLASYTNGTNAEIKLNTGLSAGPAANSTITFNPPGVIYSSNNNPLIGVMSTSKQIGVSEENNFKVQLAVAETKPVESLLDIYYETTSSGTVSSLNLAVEQGDLANTIPVKTTSIDFSLNESQTGVVTCTNTFTLLSNKNTALTGKNISGQIVSVFDRKNPTVDRSSEFSLSDDSNGTFSLATTKSAGDGYFVGEDESSTTFDFNLLMINDIHRIPIAFTGSIDNVKPAYQGTSGSDGALTTNKFGGTFGTPANKAIAFECFNGSGDTSLRTKEVKWELISAICIDGENAPVPNGWSGVGPSWRTGYVSNETATNLPNYIVQKGVDYKNLFEMASPSENTTSFNEIISSDLKFNFTSLENVGSYNYQYLQDPNSIGFIANIVSGQNPYLGTGTLTTASLVNFIKFELKLRAVDRSGSGQSAGTVTVTVTVQ